MNSKEDTKFKNNPYNFTNRHIDESDVVNIMKSLNINDFKPDNINFYKTAFIHKSYCKLKDYEEYEYPGPPCLPLQDISYETMEFLGDAILGSVVSAYLYRRFYETHKQNEGFLTKIKIRIICGENLCQLSKDLSFGKHIVMSKHVDDKCSGRMNSNILEDVFEAFIGALYLDGNYAVAEKFIIQVVEKYVDFTEILMIDNNYKDQITRYFQRIGGPDATKPLYKHSKSDETGLFLCELHHDGKLLLTGEGISKKKSEQDVSKKALIHFNVIT
jgi:ribonuclease-3|tara:strand:- start:189 stop:1007 length:819 start_codon:yes stop_codon:yes gene_type:complete